MSAYLQLHGITKIEVGASRKIDGERGPFWCRTLRIKYPNLDGKEIEIPIELYSDSPESIAIPGEEIPGRERLGMAVACD